MVTPRKRRDPDLAHSSFDPATFWPACLPSLSERLGYAFESPAWLREALTPPSAGLPWNNQRLEYLGDALLQAAMGLLIYRAKPDWNEGAMSKLRGMLVNTDSLRQWAETLGVELLKGPRTPHRPGTPGVQKPLADAMEALLAAVHEDAAGRGMDGFHTVYALVELRFGKSVREARLGVWEAQDPKTTLQERAASLGLSAPRYRLVDQSGPDHQPQFRVEVAVGTHTAEACGPTLKRAQAEAAALLLQGL